MFVAIEFRRSIDLVTHGAEFGLSQQWAHDGALVTGNIRENLFVGKVPEDGRAIFFGKQRRLANRETSSAVQARFNNGMADSTGNAFVIKRSEWRLLPRAVFAECTGKQRYRRMTAFAMTRELNASCAQQ